MRTGSNGRGRQLTLIAALALAMVPSTVAAQGTPLSLDDAVARALAESHRVAELRAREEGARAAVKGSAAAALPHVSVLAGYTRTNHVTAYGIPQPDGRLSVIYPDVPDNYRTRLDVSWPLYTGGRAESLTRAARAEADAAARDLATIEADVRLDVTRAYWTAVTAAETVSVTEQALARTDAHLSDLRARLDAGFIPPNDVLTAEAQRSRQEVQLIEARHAAELARAELRRLAALPPDAPIRLTTTLDLPDSAAGDELAAQIERAKAARPERAALLQRIEAAARRIDAAASSRLPNIALNGGYDYARPNPRIFPRQANWEDSWDVSVNASWSLWDSGRRSAEVGQATAAERALRARLEEFDTLVELELRQRRLDVESGRAAARAAAHGVRSAAEARRVLGERFSAGVATSTEVLDAQLAWQQAELDRTRALAGVRIAEARLARALGR